MKEKILFLLYLSCSVVVAQQQQQRSFMINWEASQKIVAGNYSLEIPSFNKENISFSIHDGLQFVAQWDVSNTINESSILVSNVTYASVSINDLKDLDVNTIPSQLIFNLRNSTARDKKFAVFQLAPIIKESNGTYKKVTAFQISYSSGGLSNRVSSVSKISSTSAVSNSVLNTGEWFRFYVDTTGVFKLSKNFLQRLGVKVNDIDPRTIKLYGNGGQMIPYLNSVIHPNDVEENAIKFVGEADGVFNTEDYILFYAQGPKGYNVESNTHINCYMDKTYYYINISSGLGKRIQPMSQPTGTANLVINTFQDYKFHEKDEFNLGFLGRRWFGNQFDIQTNKTFNFDFPDLVTSIPVKLKVYVASTAAGQTIMKLGVNGTEITNMSMPGFSGLTLASEAVFNDNVTVNTSKIAINLDYDKQGNPAASGYLDYISIEATRNLNFYNKQFQFKNNLVTSASGIGQYVISNASRISEVWDVSDKYNVTNALNTTEATNFSFTTTLGVLKTYVAVTPQDYFEPKLDSKTSVNNQNIKGTVFLNNLGVFQDIDYLIVAPDNMIGQAERLAQINRDQYGLNVKVYSLNDIYAEFSTGNQDIGAIRNLAKYVYNNASSPDKSIKYLCLFGDTSFDYKDRIPNNTNIVPSWYSYNSFSKTNSFVSDDFYGMMDINEGSMTTSDRLDIAVGRVLADTPQRAKEMVDKVASYYSKESYGSWRNNFVVISDDVDTLTDSPLQFTTDAIADAVSDEKPSINVVKIHSDAYKQETSAGGNRYPQVNTAFANAIDNGALVINYFGHGGVDGLSSERILLKPDIESFRNFNKFYCFVTVTCDFTKFDNPYKESGGELVYWSKQAGAIGLMATTREVFLNFGIIFNENLNRNMFAYVSGTTEYPSMAESLRITKNNIINDQNKLIYFLGDPAMKLAFPKPNVKLTKINDLPIAVSTDTLKALSKVKLAGEVTDAAGNLLTNYTGTLAVTIFDKDINRQTLANDGVSSSTGLIKLDFKTLGVIIFRGQASVKNGEFDFDFVVPKDISIPIGFGKVSFYSKNDIVLEDQAGASVNTVRIGGLNYDAETDNIGPVITLFMNDENFVSGGITNESPTLLAKLEDLNGINTASGIGHDIVAILDGDETNPFILNDYYQTEIDEYQKGIVTFPFRDLKPGLHTLTIKAWDVYNNSSVAEIQFIVFDEDEVLQINNVLNYPNPFVNYTEFWFNHNSSTPLNVSVQIFTVSGKLVKTLNGQTSGGAITNSSLSRDLVWDGRDDFGDKIGKGVYIYKLTVQSETLNKKTEKIEKLVIL